MPIVNGQDIVGIRTLDSFYANNCILLDDGKGKEYRLNVKELLKILDVLQFDANKKVKHTYLTIREDNANDIANGYCEYRNSYINIRPRVKA